MGNPKWKRHPLSVTADRRATSPVGGGLALAFTLYRIERCPIVERSPTEFVTHYLPALPVERYPLVERFSTGFVTNWKPALPVERYPIVWDYRPGTSRIKGLLFRGNLIFYIVEWKANDEKSLIFCGSFGRAEKEPSAVGAALFLHQKFAFLPGFCPVCCESRI